MMIDLSFLNSDLVISSVIAFAVGLFSVTAFSKIKNSGKRGYQADESVVEAVVLEYTRRLRDYDKVIADLRARLDIMEVRSQPYVVSQQFLQQSREPQPHVAPVSEPVAITQHATVDEKQENNGTIDYILKLLSERPLSSREVQHAIGRTREHTARLMKKLHDSGLVSRDVNAKPFRYTITGQGQERLKEKTEVAAEPPAVV